MMMIGPQGGIEAAAAAAATKSIENDVAWQRSWVISDLPFFNQATNYLSILKPNPTTI